MRAAAIAALAVLSGSRTVRAEPCPPRAEVAGDRVAVERVVAELRRLGVEIADAAAARDGCAVVRAQVGLEDNGSIAVAVRGATRGSEGRVVSDAVLAAAWIDSWTREDVDVALWAAPPPAPIETRVASIEAPGVTPPRDVAVAPPTRSRWERVAITASYEQTYADDDSTWSGASAALCVRVGAFCLGGRARFAVDPERLYNATGVGRSDASLFATASYPIAIGTMSLAPELGLGIGRMATHRAESCKALMPPQSCNPMDPMCTMPMDPGACEPTDPNMTKAYVGDGFEVANLSPRMSVAVRLAVPVFQHVWLDGLASWTFAPFAHTASYRAGESNLVPPEQIALPGEPTGAYVLGIGLRVGAR